MLNPSILFSELLSAIDNLKEQDRERSRQSSHNWRAKQAPDKLKSKQRQWEREYRTHLKQKDPGRYTAYCKGNVNA